MAKLTVIDRENPLTHFQSTLIVIVNVVIVNIVKLTFVLAAL